MGIFWCEVIHERMQLKNRGNSLLVLLWQSMDMSSGDEQCPDQLFKQSQSVAHTYE